MNIAVTAASLVLTGFVLLTAEIALLHRNRQQLAQRVEHAIWARGPALQPHGAPAPHWRVKIAQALWPLFTFGSRSGWAVTTSINRIFAIGLGGASLMWFVATLLHLPVPIAAPLALGSMLLLPRLVVARQRRRLQRQFAELFPDTVDMVVRMIRAGLPVTAAIRAVGEQAQQPVGRIFQEVADQSAIGIPLEEALCNSAVRLGSPDFRFFAVAVALQRSTGGNLAITLETLADIIRKRRAVRLKSNATTAEVRLSAYVLGGIPPLITLALSVMSPAFLDPLLHDPTGNVILGVAITFLVLAGLSMRWLAHQNVE